MAGKKKVEIDILNLSDGAVIDALFGGTRHAGAPGYLEYQQRKVVAKMRAALVEMQKLNPNIRFRIEVPGQSVKFPGNS